MSFEQARVAVVVEATNRMTAGLNAAKQDLRSFETQASRTAQTVASASQQMQISYKQMAMGMSSVFTSGFAMYSILDRVQSSALRLQTVQQGLNSVQVSLSAAQARVNKLVEQGKTGSEEYQVALERLAYYQGQVELYTAKVAEAQGNLQETYVQGALTVIPTLITAYSGLSMAGVTLTSVTKALNSAFIASPWGWVALAIGAVVMAIYQATDGFRNWRPVIDAVNKALEWLTVPLQTILDAIGTLNPKVREAAEKLREWRTNGIIPVRQSVEELASTVDPGLNLAVEAAATTLEQQLIPSLEETGPALEAVTRAVEDTTLSFKTLDEKIADLARLEFEQLTSQTGAYQAAVQQARDEVLGFLEAQDYQAALVALEKFSHEWGLTWDQALREVEYAMASAVAVTEQAVDRIEKTLETPLQFRFAYPELGEYPAYQWSPIIGGYVGIQEAEYARQIQESYRRVLEAGGVAEPYRQWLEERGYEIPTLQGGGYVTREGLAWLHPREIISPEPRLREIIREVVREREGPVQIIVNVNKMESPADEVRLARQLAKVRFEQARISRGAYG